MKRAIVGRTDLATVNPKLAAEFDKDKNIGISVVNLLPGSGQKVWWLCERGHSWEASVNSRSQGSGCPTCSKIKAIVGKTDLLTVNPNLAMEFDPIKNVGIRVIDLTAGSDKDVWWLCKNGHSWKSRVCLRSKGCGCPYCSRHKVLKGENDLQTANPALAEEFDTERNIGISPSDLLSGSDKKVWWRCKKGHRWQAKVFERSAGKGCPYCSRRLTMPGETDLQTVFPELAQEFDYERNEGIQITDIAPYSKKNLWWKCKEGHRWQATPANRAHGTGCPYCSVHRAIIGGTDFGTLFPELAEEVDPEKNEGVDIHKLTVGSGVKLWWKCKEGHRWQTSVVKRTHGGKCPYCLGKKVIIGETDFQTLKPELAKEFDTKKNIGIDIHTLSVKSGKKVWWLCGEGHNWKTSVADRARGRGCPFCSRKRVIVGKTDLQTVNPELAKEFNIEKNIGIKLCDLSIGSGKVVWWKCKRGHEWRTSVLNRKHGRGCPYCSGRRVIVGENDLQTVNPKLAEEFDSERNIGINLLDLKPGSTVKVWWKCKEGHKWQARVSERTRGRGCPFCAGKRVVIGRNDLKTLFPEIAKEFAPDMNPGIRLEDLSYGSTKKIFWKCDSGHVWRTAVLNRTWGKGCPYCAGNKAISGKTDLQTVNPELAKEFDKEKNGDIKINEITSKSTIKYWWKCEAGHNWQASVANRSKGRGCPYCSGKRAILGVTDLRTTNPELVEEFDFDKNKTIRIEELTAGSEKKVWWRCKEGHGWLTIVALRAKGARCPYCAGTKTIVGKNDLKTLFPELAAEFDVEKNRRIRLEDISIGSERKVWWKCSEGHSWKAIVNSRTRGNGCPLCSNRRKVSVLEIVGKSDLLLD